MSKYKVKVIQLALRNNKIAKSGELVKEGQLTRDAADLVKEGFIEKVGNNDAEKKAAEKVAKEAAEKEAAEKAEKEAAEKAAFDEAYEAGSLDADQLEYITKNEIYEYAKKHALKFDEGAKKPELIEQVLKAEKEA